MLKNDTKYTLKRRGFSSCILEEHVVTEEVDWFDWDDKVTFLDVGRGLIEGREALDL